jgi:hypothetical protein
LRHANPLLASLRAGLGPGLARQFARDPGALLGCDLFAAFVGAGLPGYRVAFTSAT